MTNELKTDNPTVAALWLAWQMTLEQLQRKDYEDGDDYINLQRELFKQNYALMAEASKKTVKVALA